MKEYLIIEEGEYSNYSVYFIEKSHNLSDEETIALISLDSWGTPSIGGRILGEITDIDKGSLRVEDIKTVATYGINRMFCCYPTSKKNDITDRIYSQDELLKIAMINDNSGEVYWQGKLPPLYKKYLKAMELLNKLNN